jgi:hypothetical protein
MLLEITQDLKEAIQNKTIDFLSFYDEREVKMWQDEINELFNRGATKRLENLLGYTLYYVAQALNQNKGGEYDDYKNDEIIISIGLNPSDYKYIYQFAIAMIIEDFNNVKMFGKADITEGLQVEHTTIIEK